MKTGKSLVGTQQEEWRSHVVEFRYKGKAYNSPVTDNLVLDDLSVDEVKDNLNMVPGKLSFWKSLQVGVEREIADLEEDYDLWFQKKYMELDEQFSKNTETWKKSKVILDNSAEYRTRKAAIRDLQDVNKKIGVLTTGYNTMTWTLREIARLTYQELANLEIRGRGTLAGR